MNRKLIALLALALTLASPFASAQPTATTKPLPTITVEASYPGTNAQVVADTVAAPIEQEVNGVEGMLHMRSRSSNDGRYVLAVTFKAGTDIKMALVLVQNRVALAMPVLPDIVNRSGVTVHKSADVLLFVAVSSAGAAHDLQFLSNFATVNVVDELKRIAGVSNVKTIGARDGGMRIWLDPQKLAAREMTPADIVNAIKQQNLLVEAGKIGQPPEPKGGAFQLEIKSLGRLTDADEFGNIVVKAGPEGALVRLRDVARVERRSQDVQAQAFLNGKEVVLLAIHPILGTRPGEVTEAIRLKLAQLRERAPKGLKIDVAMDFTPGRIKAPEYCRIDVDLPMPASVERTAAVLAKCQALVGKIDGVQDVLAMTDPDMPHQGQLLVSLAGGADAAERAKRITAMREWLHDHADAVIRVAGPSGSSAGLPAYPVRFAVCDAADKGFKALGEQADVMARRLAESKKLIDVWASSDFLNQDHVELNFDRDKAQNLGVSAADLFNTLQVYLGSYYVNDANRFGRTWQVVIKLNEPNDKDEKGKGKPGIDDLKQLQVRSKAGKMVRLDSIVSTRSVSGPLVIDRCNMEPMVTVTANLAPGTSPAEARTLCEKLAADVLPAGYRLKWLR